MKIIYCIHSTSNSGGMERVLSNKINYLAKLENYEVIIVTTDQQAEPHFYEVPSNVKCIDLGINYSETINEGIIYKTFKSFGKYITHKKRLKKLLFELNADVVVSMFNNDVSFLHKINDKSKKIVEIHFCREFRLLAERKGVLRLLDIYKTYVNDRIVKHYDSFVVLTKEDKKSWKPNKNIKVIPNALPCKEVKVSKLENKNILCIGRYSYQKNFELLIDIWKEVSRNYPQWKLTIVGSGDFSYILKKVEEYSVQNSVKILPPTDAIEDLYSESSIYVMTSRYEGLPMVLVESQNFGLPIVSFDCKCGPKEIINDGIDGFLIERWNVKDFTEKVTRLIESEVLRKSFGEKAKLNAMRFSEEKIMQEWVSLFEEITDNS